MWQMAITVKKDTGIDPTGEISAERLGILNPFPTLPLRSLALRYFKVWFPTDQPCKTC